MTNNANDLIAQNLYRAYVAYFLYTADLAAHDPRIAHQLLNNAENMRQASNTSAVDVNQIIARAHADVKTETSD
jgi:hypothetical protein